MADSKLPHQEFQQCPSCHQPNTTLIYSQFDASSAVDFSASTSVKVQQNSEHRSDDMILLSIVVFQQRSSPSHIKAHNHTARRGDSRDDDYWVKEQMNRTHLVLFSH